MRPDAVLTGREYIEAIIVGYLVCAIVLSFAVSWPIALLTPLIVPLCALLALIFP